MNTLQDVVTYFRRMVKTPSGAVLSDALIIDYINRFWTADISARMQLFDLKTTYQVETIPGIISYNMPYYTVQGADGDISYYPVYQGFEAPTYVNGILSNFYTELNSFLNVWPNYMNYFNGTITGNGGTYYEFPINYSPILPGYLDTTGIIASGNLADPIFTNNQVYISSLNSIIPYSSYHPRVKFTATDANGNTMQVHDSGMYFSGGSGSDLYGLLMTRKYDQSGKTAGFSPADPYNYTLYDTYSTTLNVINYTKGTAYINFPGGVPSGNQINAQFTFLQQGLPRGILYHNNAITVLPPPNIAYNVQLAAYLTLAAFLNTNQALQFGYMAEYLARGAARKLLSDTGDWDQFNAYEPLFREQEQLVWKRSQRQFTATRTSTIFSQAPFQNNFNSSGSGY